MEMPSTEHRDKQWHNDTMVAFLLVEKPGVPAACTDRSRVPDTRRVPVRSRGSRTFVQIEAGGFYPRCFYPRFYGMEQNYVTVTCIVSARALDKR